MRMIAIDFAQRLNYKEQVTHLLMSKRSTGKQSQTVRCIINVPICNKKT